MRGLAYRRHKATTHYLKRANSIFYTYGGYYIGDGKLVKRSESIKEYLEQADPYLLKNQGSFRNKPNIGKKLDNKKAKLSQRRLAKKELNEELINVSND